MSLRLFFPYKGKESVKEYIHTHTHTHTHIHLATPETKTALQINSMSTKIFKVWPKFFKVMFVNLKPLITYMICVVSAAMPEEGKEKQMFIMLILRAEHKI